MLDTDGAAGVSSPDLASFLAAAKSQYRTVEEMVVATIREAILSGMYEPGQRLPQEQLAESLDVSRIPVRSALRQLEAEGLVAFLPHRGASVRALSADEIAEIYELRIVLETHLLRGVFEQITPLEIEELTVMVDDLDLKAEGEDWATAREQFYDRLYSIAAKPRCADLVSRLRSDVGRYWLRIRMVYGRTHTHHVIIDALNANDFPKAEAWLKEHLSKVSDQLQRRISDGK